MVYTNALRACEDPSGYAKKIEKQWIVTDRIQVGRQVKDKVVKCNELMIRPGDFVDVTAVAEIFQFNHGTGRDVVINFAMRRVVQLQAATISRAVSVGNYMVAFG